MILVVKVDQSSKFCNKSMKSWLLRDKGFEVYSTHLFRTLKNKVYNYMIAVSKNVYIDKLDEIIDKYKNIYHRTIKMKPVDVTLGTYIGLDANNNDKDPTFKVGDYDVRIPKYKNISAKGSTPSQTEEGFIIKQAKNTIPWAFVTRDLDSEKVIRTFFEKELQQTS